MILDPAAIAVEELPFRALKLRRQLPKAPCVYFVLGENARVLYIGSSICLHKRWQKHDRTWQVKEIPEARIAWLVLEDARFLKAAEAVLIAHFCPPWNDTPLVPGYPRTRSRNRSYAKMAQRLLREAWDPGNTEGDEHY